MKPPKPIKELLEQLPEPYRTQALNNLHPMYQPGVFKGKNILTSPREAIKVAFIWGAAPEGWGYWDKLFNSLEP